MNPVKVSIIIPVFNAAKYVEQCIRSLLDQTLSEIEIIVVNDGSTDGSKEIISRLTATDKRILTINSTNQGVSASRNKGLKLARGQYIGFADADDWAEPELYETLYAKATGAGADIAICNVRVVEENITTRPRLYLDSGLIDISKNRAAELVSWMRFTYDYANWNKIYSAGIIKKHKLLFTEGMCVWEDLLFNLCYLQYAAKGITVSTCLYNYRIHPASVMNRNSHDTVTEYNHLFSGFRDFCDQHNFTEAFSIFRKEMSRGFYYAIIPKLYGEIKKLPVSFSRRVGLLAKALRQVNKDLFVFDAVELKGVQGFKKRLLLKRACWLFSFIVAMRGSK